MVRLFETSDKLEEHLNRGNLRPDQVTSISIDADGFFVLVYWVGGGPPEGERRPFRAELAERRPPARRRFEEEGDGEFREERSFGRSRSFETEGPGRREFPQRRPPRR
jgi:hypothetical protein